MLRTRKRRNATAISTNKAVSWTIKMCRRRRRRERWTKFSRLLKSRAMGKSYRIDKNVKSVLVVAVVCTFWNSFASIFQQHPRIYFISLGVCVCVRVLKSLSVCFCLSFPFLLTVISNLSLNLIIRFVEWTKLHTFVLLISWTYSLLDLIWCWMF